ncbi:ORF6C domain-containing protein [Metasolibacillus meyeri]|uniref:ORF6C domain-containing protein n=1 Tax=Metasolibacillus meyeri TaxID=1071052 RepID=A0AAW9NPV4_9BACL|nr:ORF6C domain-containing protein [Metasolibacillus meyeri]MEC1177294.1 ORF6C domain-containing protein [Metasolibacillus meyeri]
MEKQLHQDVLQEGEQIRIRKAISERVYTLTDKPGARQALFKSLYTALKERYGVDYYGDIKQMQDALRFIAQWKG